MNFKQLYNIFLNHAIKLQNDKEPTARFRAVNYSRIAYLLEQKRGLVTMDKINKLGISKHMTQVISDILNGTSKLMLNKFKDKAKTSATVTYTNTYKAKTPVSANDSRTTSSNSNTVNHANTKLNKLQKDLTNIMGIGPAKARELIAAGVKDISDLTYKKYTLLLSNETKLFLSMDPLKLIPHAHIKALEPYINKLQTDDMKLTFVGSYRRKKPFSKDIDIMVISNKANTIDLFTNGLIKALKGKAYPYSKGSDKASIIIDLSDVLNKPKTVYKIDVFRTSPREEIPMLLYSTGSKEFNIAMRGRAKKLGYLLNQKGLFKNGKKITNLITEKDYFTILDMPYVDPVNRI